MNLRDTILGLLSWKPASGYDLKRIISESDIFYWSGNNNQIYKSLLELQKEGLVSYQVQLQDSLPAKKIYSITAQGPGSAAAEPAGSPRVARAAQELPDPIGVGRDAVGRGNPGLAWQIRSRNRQPPANDPGAGDTT